MIAKSAEKNPLEDSAENVKREKRYLDQVVERADPTTSEELGFK